MKKNDQKSIYFDVDMQVGSKGKENGY